LGRDSLGKSLSDCWKYDPTNNSWTEVAPFPDSARVKAIAAVVNGKAYVGLGFYLEKDNGMNNGVGMLKGFWMYTPETNKWTKKANFPSIAADACVSFVKNNEIYVGAGFNGLGFSNEFWKYNTLSDKWIQLNDFAGEARAGGISCGDSTHIYFGTGYQTTNENDWWEYFPQTDSWTKRKSMPDNGRENGVALTINGRYFVSTGRHFGGNYTGGNIKSDIIEYDAIRDVWYERGNIPSSGRENAISFTINGKGYIGFGENDNAVLNDLWSFEP
jgi:N-acetylneuraminic acid mutarotase